MSPPFSIVHTETTNLIKRGAKSLQTHSLLCAIPSEPLVIKHHKCPAQRDGSFRFKTQSNGYHKSKAGLSHAARTNFSELSVSGYIHPRRVHGACASESRRPVRPPPKVPCAAPKQKKILTKRIKKKKLKSLFFVAVSKNVFSSKTERFFFVFSPWCTL